MTDELRTEKTTTERVEFEIQPQKNTHRVWEVDFLRGVLILFVVWDHLMFDVGYLFSFGTEFGKALREFARAYETGALRTAMHVYFLIGFVMLSGVSSSFSKNNWVRGLKMLAFAYGLTACSILGAKFFGDGTFTIRFNVLHVIGYSILITEALKQFRTPKTIRCVLALIIVVVGATFLVQPADYYGFFYFMVLSTGAEILSAGDFLPLFPYLGWFLFGALLGEKVYPEKRTVFPTLVSKYTKPFEFCGRHSLAIYFLSQVAAYALLSLLVGLKWL